MGGGFLLRRRMSDKPARVIYAPPLTPTPTPLIHAIGSRSNRPPRRLHMGMCSRRLPLVAHAPSPILGTPSSVPHPRQPRETADERGGVTVGFESATATTVRAIAGDAGQGKGGM